MPVGPAPLASTGPSRLRAARPRFRWHTSDVTRLLCRFHLREGVPDGFRYSPLDVAGAHGAAYPVTVPPSVGDIVALHGTGVVAVVARQWGLPEYGSRAFPRDAQEPKDVYVTLIVVRAEGVFRDEVDDPATTQEEL